MVLDMGGGTTDIAAFQITGGKYDRVMVDSLRYAGHDFIDLILKDKGFISIFSNHFFKGSEISDHKEPLRSIIRDPEHFEQLKTLIKNYPDPALISSLQKFFEGLFLYTCRLVMAFKSEHDKTASNTKKAPSTDGESHNNKARPFTVDVSLLGNGWGLARLAYDSPIKEIIRREVIEKCKLDDKTVKCRFTREENALANIPGIDDKTLVAYGALMAAKDDAQHNEILNKVDEKLFLTGFRIKYGKDIFFPATALVPAREMAGNKDNIALNVHNLPDDLDLPSGFIETLNIFYDNDIEDQVINKLRKSLPSTGNAMVIKPRLLGDFLVSTWKKAIAFRKQ